MSGWINSWFGGASSAKTAQASKNAIVGLRTQLDMLQKREAYTQKQILEQDNIARANVTVNKTAARGALKKKKQLETNLVATQQHIATLETQMYAVENANINIETVKAMKNAAEAMKGIHKGMGIDDVETTMDEIKSHMQDAEDISQAITSVQFGEPLDEDEIAKELEELEQENLDKQMLEAPAAPVTATPGMVKPVAARAPVVVEDEEEELRKLQAEMAM